MDHHDTLSIDAADHHDEWGLVMGRDSRQEEDEPSSPHGPHHAHTKSGRKIRNPGHRFKIERSISNRAEFLRFELESLQARGYRSCWTVWAGYSGKPELASYQERDLLPTSGKRSQRGSRFGTADTHPRPLCESKRRNPRAVNFNPNTQH